MNTILLLIIIIPALEIFLFIKIGSQIGAITTVLLIFTTAIVGVYYAKYEGLNTLKSGFSQLIKNELYNLIEDPEEKHNVYDEFPEIASKMEELGEKARTELGDNLTGFKGKENRKSGK